MNKRKIAIIGCGNIGQRYLMVVEKEEKADLVAICDSDQTVLYKNKSLYPYVSCYTNLDEMLKEVSIDLLIISTPHHLHKEMAVKACEYKKNVLVEKPMALSTKDCEIMYQAAKKNNVQLSVVKQNRFNLPVFYTKDVIDKNLLGEIYLVKCDILWNRHKGYYNHSDWRGKIKTEGGALYTIGSHFIDLLLLWFGQIIEVKGMRSKKFHDIEFEDVGAATIKFKSGAIGNLNWTTCAYNKNVEGSITIIAKNGTIKIGGRYLNKIEYWDVKAYPLQEGVEYIDKPNIYTNYQGTSSNHDKLIHKLCRDFEYINNFEMVDAIEGRKTIDAIEFIYDSIEISK